MSETPPPPILLLFGPQTWQIFRDDQEAEIHPEILHGTWQELYEGLRQRNEAGAGVYYTVNGTDGQGRSAANITEIRAWYTDIDGLPTDDLKRGAIRRLLEHQLSPSCIVVTRNGVHAIWYAVPGEPVDKEHYRETEEGLIRYWGGDPSAKDLSRVLRAPGFFHRKRKAGEKLPEPYEITLAFESEDFYTSDELREAFPPPKREYRQDFDRSAVTYSEDDWGKVAGAIADWRPVPMARHRVMTLACGVAYKFGIPEGRAVDDLMPIVASWDTGRDMVSELKRTAKWAYAQATPATVSALRNEGVPVPPLSRPKD